MIILLIMPCKSLASDNLFIVSISIAEVVSKNLSVDEPTEFIWAIAVDNKVVNALLRLDPLSQCYRVERAASGTYQ